MSHHSKHHFITQYILTLQWMSFIEWYEFEQPVMLEVTEQRPMNNEYVNIMNW